MLCHEVVEASMSERTVFRRYVGSIDVEHSVDGPSVDTEIVMALRYPSAESCLIYLDEQVDVCRFDGERRSIIGIASCSW